LTFLLRINDKQKPAWAACISVYIRFCYAVFIWEQPGEFELSTGQSGNMPSLSFALSKKKKVQKFYHCWSSQQN